MAGLHNRVFGGDGATATEPQPGRAPTGVPQRLNLHRTPLRGDRPNSPEKPATPKKQPTAKQKPAKKLTAATIPPDQEADIAAALKRYLTHLKRFDTGVALAFARLKDTYLKHGITASVKGGRKVG